MWEFCENVRYSLNFVFFPIVVITLCYAKRRRTQIVGENLLNSLLLIFLLSY